MQTILASLILLFCILIDTGQSFAERTPQFSSVSVKNVGLRKRMLLEYVWLIRERKGKVLLRGLFASLSESAWQNKFGGVSWRI